MYFEAEGTIRELGDFNAAAAVCSNSFPAAAAAAMSVRPSVHLDKSSQCGRLCLVQAKGRSRRTLHMIGYGTGIFFFEIVALFGF